jgi:N-acetylgalactosamine-6-sulfatase
LRGAKRNLYEGGIRVPFIVRWPGRTPAGATDTTSVINAVDLLPTFCEIAGVSLPEGYEPDGESFLPALRGEAWQRDRPLFWECYNGSARGDNWARLAIRDGNWKLLMDPEGERVELYDIPNDAGESSNLAAEHPERVRDLRAKIKAWKSTLPTEPPANAISIHR